METDLRYGLFGTVDMDPGLCRRVTEAARTLFRERGLEAEIREITVRDRLGFGTVYRNSPTRDELIMASAVFA